jgi:hypothetical protein
MISNFLLTVSLVFLSVHGSFQLEEKNETQAQPKQQQQQQSAQQQLGYF